MGLFLLSALTPALIPFAVDKNGDLTQIGYAAGALFWLGLLLGIAAYLFLTTLNSDRTGRKTETSVSDLLFQ